MQKVASSEQVDQLEKVVRAINVALANSALYPAGHPSYAESARVLHSALTTWLQLYGRLDLAFSPKGLLLGGEMIAREIASFSEIATYFYRRGLLALKVQRSVTEEEVSALLEAAKGSPEAVTEAGGIAPRLRGCPNLVARQLDFSRVAAAGGGQKASRDPDALWKDLVRLATESPSHGADRDGARRLEKVLQNPGAVADALNSAWDVDAQSGAARSGQVARKVLAEVFRISNRAPSALSANTRRLLGEVAARLRPEVILQFFDAKAASPSQENLQQELVHLCPDHAMADFLVSLLNRQDRIDQTLLNLFDRLSAVPDKCSSVATRLVANLTAMHREGRMNLPDLAAGIAKAMDGYHTNAFMSTVYKLTMDAIASAQSREPRLSPELARMVEEFENGQTAEQLLMVRIRLLLNVLWYENDPEAFIELVVQLADDAAALPRSELVALAPDLAKLLATKLVSGPAASEQRADNALRRLAAMVDVQWLVDMIPSADENSLRGISFALGGLGERALDPLIGACARALDPACRRRLIIVLAGMELDETRALSMVEQVLKKLKRPALRMQVMNLIACTRDRALLSALFSVLTRSFLRAPLLRYVVVSCGQNRVQESVPHLAALLKGPNPLRWLWRGALAASVRESLKRIGTPAAAEALRPAVSSPRPAAANRRRSS